MLIVNPKDLNILNEEIYNFLTCLCYSKLNIGYRLSDVFYIKTDAHEVVLNGFNTPSHINNHLVSKNMIDCNSEKDIINRGDYFLNYIKKDFEISFLDAPDDYRDSFIVFSEIKNGIWNEINRINLVKPHFNGDLIYLKRNNIKDPCWSATPVSW